MPIDWETHCSRAGGTVEDLVVPFLMKGNEMWNLAAAQRYRAYLGTLDVDDMGTALDALLYELSLTVALLARKASPEQPREALAEVRNAVNWVRNMTPLERVRVTEAFKVNGPRS